MRRQYDTGIRLDPDWKDNPVNIEQDMGRSGYGYWRIEYTSEHTTTRGVDLG